MIFCNINICKLCLIIWYHNIIRNITSTSNGNARYFNQLKTYSTGENENKAHWNIKWYFVSIVTTNIYSYHKEQLSSILWNVQTTLLGINLPKMERRARVSGQSTVLNTTRTTRHKAWNKPERIIWFCHGPTLCRICNHFRGTTKFLPTKNSFIFEPRTSFCYIAETLAGLFLINKINGNFKTISFKKMP